MLPKLTSPENVSNRVTRLLNISLKEPGIATLEREIQEFPKKREQELSRLKDELDEKYNETVADNNYRLSEKRTKLASLKSGHTTEKNLKKGSILTISENITRMKSEMESMQVQLRKDTIAIRWLNAWRVFWGIIATALLFVVIIYYIFRGVLWFVSLFIPGDKDDD